MKFLEKIFGVPSFDSYLKDMKKRRQLHHRLNCNCHCHKMFELVFDCIDCGYKEEE